MEIVQKVKLLILTIKTMAILTSSESRVSGRINEARALQVRVQASVDKYLITIRNHYTS